MCISPEEYFFQDTNFCEHFKAPISFSFPGLRYLDLELMTWTWQLTKNVWLNETEPWTKQAEIICYNTVVTIFVFICLHHMMSGWVARLQDVWRLRRLSNLRAGASGSPAPVPPPSELGLSLVAADQWFCWRRISSYVNIQSTFWLQAID